MSRSLITSASNYTSNIFKKVFDRDLTSEEVESLFRLYYKAVQKILSRYSPHNYKRMARRVELAGLGFYILRHNVVRRKKLFKNTVNRDVNDLIDNAAEMRKKGWHFLFWDEKKGFAFYYEGEHLIYYIKREGVYTTLEAYRYLSKISDFKLTKLGVRILTVADFIEIKDVPSGNIKVYNKDGILIKEYANLTEACKGKYFTREHIHNILIYNFFHQDRPRRLRDEYWFFDRGYGKYKKFNPTNVNSKRTVIFDLLDAKTGKVIIERIGTLSDIHEYFKSIGKKKSSTGALEQIYKNNGTIYGFKLRRSTIQISKY